MSGTQSFHCLRSSFTPMSLPRAAWLSSLSGALLVFAAGCQTPPANPGVTIAVAVPQFPPAPQPVLPSHGPANPMFWICGVWEGKGPDGADWVFVFAPNGAADLIKDGLGYGKDPQNRDPFVLGYSFNPLTAPAEVNYHVEHQSGRKTLWRGIAEMTGPKTMRIRLRDDGQRPISFDEDAPGATRTLTRVHDWSHLVAAVNP